MEKPILVCLFFITVFFSSCEYYTTSEKLVAYDRISGINDSLDKMTKEWHRLLDNAVSGKNYSSLRPYRVGMGMFINNSREIVEKLKVNSNSKNLIDSEVVFLAGQASVVSDLYSNFDSFNEITPDELIQGQLKLVVDEKYKEAAGSAGIKRSLIYFATKNNLKKKRKL